MATYYVSSVKWAAFATWAASTAYTVGQIVKRPGTTSLRHYRCEVAGTSGASQPTWQTTPNGTMTDNGITWRCISCVASYGWDSAVGTIIQTVNVANAGNNDVVFVDSTHDEVDAGNVGTNGSLVISVNAAGSVPPVKADYQRGAKCRITATGTLGISTVNAYGLDFVADTGSSAGSINACSGNNGNFFSDCLFHLKNTSSSSQITLNGTLGGLSEWTNNTRVRFGGHASQIITLSNVALNWSNGDVNSVSADTVMPTALFNSSTFNGTPVTVRGVDLTGFTGTRFITADAGRSYLFEDCRLADSVAYINGNSGSRHPDGANVRFINCSRVTVQTKQSMYNLESIYNKQWTPFCVLANTPDLGSGKQTEIHRIISTNSQGFPSKGLMVKKWNKSVSALTATIRGIYFGPTLPTQADFFMTLSYPGDANDSLAHWAFDVAQRLETTAGVSDTSDWTGAAATRANSTSYAQGDFIKVASNPGKIFVRENSGAGTSRGTEPAGFATATYGSTVSDNTCTWRCGIPFKLQQAFTPARAGPVRAQALLYPISSSTYVVALNPKLEIA